MYLYLVSRTETERQIIEAECAALTGAVPDSLGIAVSELEADVSRAAYVKMCMEVLIHDKQISAIYKQLEIMGISSDRFRVSVVKSPRSLLIDPRAVMNEVGARIAGKPDLSNPKTVFLVVFTEDDVWLGKVLSESDGLWERHSRKMHQYSSSLPSQLARAMVNLVSAPGDKIIDPCCGSGTILIEAASMGIKALGCDINYKMAKASAENLKYFGLDGLVLMADARDIKGRFDAVVTDLPYGRNCPADAELCGSILKNLPNLAPRTAIVVNKDMRDMLLNMGHNVKKVVAVPKGSLTRYIHIVQFSLSP